MPPSSLETDLKQWDRGLYRVSLFVPPSQRPLYLALFHLFTSLIRIIDRPKEPLLVPIKLTWWRDWLESAESSGYGLPHEDILRGHAVFQELPALIDHFILGWEHDQLPDIGGCFFEIIARLDGRDDTHALSLLSDDTHALSLLSDDTHALSLLSDDGIVDHAIHAAGCQWLIWRYLSKISPRDIAASRDLLASPASQSQGAERRPAHRPGLSPTLKLFEALAPYGHSNFKELWRLTWRAW